MPRGETENTSAPRSLLFPRPSTNNSGGPQQREVSSLPKLPSHSSSPLRSLPQNIHRPFCLRVPPQVSKRVSASPHLLPPSSLCGLCRRVLQRSLDLWECMLDMLLRMGGLIRRRGGRCSLMGMKRRG